MIYYTEGEAKTKWCPYARVYLWEKSCFDEQGTAASFNRECGPYHLPPTGSECIGDACMKWRWRDARQGWCGA